ncbi:MAG TPA: hypothetical protein VMV25_05960 [Steroidobacteraceae bacterium]|nr:hypothetical protein [Steroidobacteraceae bacterium]
MAIRIWRFFGPIAGNELVGIYKRASTRTNTLYYVLGDHQGSFAHILTSAGTNDVTESFTASGDD